MGDFFPESLGQKRGCAVYTEAHCARQNTVDYHHANQNWIVQEVFEFSKNAYVHLFIQVLIHSNTY